MKKTEIDEWEYNGIPCRVMLVQDSHYCGYLQTPITDGVRWTPTHDDKLGLLEADVDVHGGVTYGPDDDGWVGFDCAHAGDYCFKDGRELESIGKIEQYHPGDEFHTKWTVEDVRAEIESLADQLIELMDDE